MDPDDLPVRRGLTIPAEELVLTTSRSGGPGGQNVNKVATRVTLRWSVRDSAVLKEVWRDRLRDKLGSRLTREGELVLHVDTTRSQAANKQEARQRLADLVREALIVPRARKPTRPTRGSRKRRLQSKRRRSEVKRQRRRPPGEE